MENEIENVETSHHYSDSINNVVEIGDLKLKSPNEMMDDLISKAKALLKDKEVREYLTELKNIKLKLGKSYFG